jgi:hypothetical protein
LSKGGVIAHLAWDFVTAQDVVYGPLDDVLDGAEALLLGWKALIFDNNMSADEEDIICSVYQVDTGQSHPIWGHQMTDLSWWPKLPM